MERLLLTPKEAAEALAIGRSKVYELIASGELESVRIGGSRRVTCDALRAFIGALHEGHGSRARQSVQGATVRRPNGRQTD